MKKILIHTKSKNHHYEHAHLATRNSSAADDPHPEAIRIQQQAALQDEPLGGDHPML